MNRQQMNRMGEEYEAMKWREYEEYLNEDEIDEKRECDNLTTCERRSCHGCRMH